MREAGFTTFLVDDDPAVLKAITRLLNAAGYRTKSFSSPQEFLSAHDPSIPGCAIIDLVMSELDGLHLQQALLETGSERPIIFLSGKGDVSTSVRAMKAGAVDFIEKPCDDERLIAAIEAALANSGRAFRDQEVAEAAGRIATLSGREREVLDAVVAGRQSKVIAHDLGLSVRTVEVHRARLLERLGVRRLAEAVRLAVLAGLAPETRRTVR